MQKNKYVINTKKEGNFEEVIKYGQVEDILYALGNDSESHDYSRGIIQKNEDIIFHNIFFILKIKNEFFINEEGIKFIIKLYNELNMKYHEYILSLDKNIIENNDLYFSTRDQKAQWILFDFKKYEVLVSQYTFKTNVWSDSGFIKSWVLVSSNDGINFNEISKQLNCYELNGPGKIATFYANQNIPQRYIGLKQIGENWEVIIFGKIFE